MNIADLIKPVIDFPKPGILFYDLNPLIYHNQGFQQVIHFFMQQFKGRQIDKVVGIEARGFIFGASLAYALKVGFVPIRKPHKLPGPIYQQAYQLEYGKDILELQQEALRPGERVLIIDDVLASGGTLVTSIHLLQQAQVNIIGCGVVVELTHLKARQRTELSNVDIYALHLISDAGATS